MTLKSPCDWNGNPNEYDVVEGDSIRVPGLFFMLVGLGLLPRRIPERSRAGRRPRIQPPALVPASSDHRTSHRYRPYPMLNSHHPLPSVQPSPIRAAGGPVQVWAAHTFVQPVVPLRMHAADPVLSSNQLPSIGQLRLSEDVNEASDLTLPPLRLRTPPVVAHWSDEMEDVHHNILTPRQAAQYQVLTFDVEPVFEVATPTSSPSSSSSNQSPSSPLQLPESLSPCLGLPFPLVPTTPSSTSASLTSELETTPEVEASVTTTAPTPKKRKHRKVRGVPDEEFVPAPVVEGYLTKAGKNYSRARPASLIAYTVKPPCRKKWKIHERAIADAALARHQQKDPSFDPSTADICRQRSAFTDMWGEIMTLLPGRTYDGFMTFGTQNWGRKGTRAFAKNPKAPVASRSKPSKRGPSTRQKRR